MTRSRRVRPTCSREVAAAGGMTRGWRVTWPTSRAGTQLLWGRHGCRRTTGVPMSFHRASDRVVREPATLLGFHASTHAGGHRNCGVRCRLPAARLRATADRRALDGSLPANSREMIMKADTEEGWKKGGGSCESSWT
jgi:hypothetical protein